MAAIKETGEKPEEDKPQIYSVHMENEKPQFSRRDFIAKAAAVVAGTAVTGCTAAETESSQDEVNVTPTKKKSPTSTKTQKPSITATRTPTTTPTKTQAPTETPEPILGIVSKAHNIWEGPDTNHPHVAKTVAGEEVSVLNRTEDGIWFEVIDSEGNHGWGFAEFIDIKVDINDIPVASNIPTQPPFIGFAATVTQAHTIFEGPNSNHPSIGKTVKGDNIRVLSRTPDNIWLEIIDSQGNQGWVFADFIQLDVDIEQIPVGKNVPTSPPAPCSCDGDCGCDGVCGCDGDCGCDDDCGCDGDGGGGTYCTCDEIHYWYPN